jgi:hypothetical protein
VRRDEPRAGRVAPSDALRAPYLKRYQKLRCERATEARRSPIRAVPASVASENFVRCGKPLQARGAFHGCNIFERAIQNHANSAVREH